MAARVEDLHLPAIPETRPLDYRPVSARASPRSTSDSPAYATLPISPTSRLLKPTLSWQAKAGWMSEPATALGPNPTGIEDNAGSSQRQVPTTRDQATAAAGQWTPSPPAASWQAAADPPQTLGGDTGKQHDAKSCCVRIKVHRWHCRLRSYLRRERRVAICLLIVSQRM